MDELFHEFPSVRSIADHILEVDRNRGEWKNDVKTGKGILTDRWGNKYLGIFYRGQLEDGMWNLRCPSVGCTAAPHDGTMALLPGGELLATWRAQLRSAARNVHLQELLAESPELASWAKGGNAQACPSCFSLVQRTEGCPHMTCKCGAQFCYTCGAPWPCGQSHADTLPRLAEPEAVVPEAVAVPVAA